MIKKLIYGSVKHRIDWANINKVRIANSDDSFAKHEHIKLEIMRQILLKYRRKADYQEVYSEYAFNGRIADIVHINKHTKEVMIYEIQKQITDKWENEAIDYYEHLIIDGYKVDWQLVDLNKISENLDIMIKQLRGVVV